VEGITNDFKYIVAETCLALTAEAK